MRCRFSQEHPEEACFCSACHLSSELFPRREDGKIVLPVVPATGDSPLVCADPHPTASRSPLQASVTAPVPFRLPAPLTPDQLPPVTPLASQPVPPITTERANYGHRPRARSNARTIGSGTSTRLRSVTIGTDTNTLLELSIPGSGTSTSNLRPRSRSQSYLTTTTAVSNPYPIPNDTPYPKSSVDSRSKGSASSASLPSASISASTTLNSAPTPPLKFCPPFVSCDRIAIPADSEAAKEGVTMIPWSVRRRKQKYRSGFDNGTGGKGKTMFRYYGPDNEPSGDSSSSANKKR
ncbi:hypothetical protein P691DRAFT_167319 [Macrolepiota fuliginosa MF-IS2]|uniref:Uncharacterized protein n=1 Tax=Macrolepiota fuliginosa MF-IS2 TaxID=1400762 RepID=A0A9P5X9V0_9AGAR|nr:hypothetical protein P691DRAFT_167319 [Macrolepiota fuliginosa MF-IS2]